MVGAAMLSNSWRFARLLLRPRAGLPPGRPNAPAVPPRPGFTDYRCILHAHAEDSTHTGGTLKDMLAEAKKAGVQLLVGHSHSFDAPILRTRQIIAGGEVGADDGREAGDDPLPIGLAHGAKAHGGGDEIARKTDEIGFEQRGERKPLLYPVADRLIFSKVRAALGLDRCRMQVTSAAPISRSTLEFFLALGIPIYEVYGMSECTGPATVSLPGRYRTGKAGYCLPGAELKIAPDGEVCMRGRHVFRGYLKNEAATAETLDAEGFLQIVSSEHRSQLQNLEAAMARLQNLLATALDLCLAAFPGNFSPEDWEHTFGGERVLVLDGDVLVGHLAVVPRRIRVAARWYDAGYVEGVAVLPERSSTTSATSTACRPRRTFTAPSSRRPTTSPVSRAPRAR